MSYKQYSPSKSGTYDSSSVSESAAGNCFENDCYQGNRGFIICPPTDNYEKYDFSESDSSCPDLSKLCQDEKRVCKKLKNLCDKQENVADKKERKEKPKKDNCGCKKKSEECSCLDNTIEKKKNNKDKKFVVSFGPKKGHPWAEYNKGDTSIHVGGKNGPVLHLYRGVKYFFCFDDDNNSDSSCEHSLILTNSPAGGTDSRSIVGGFAPFSKGVSYIKVDDQTPRYFFYQDLHNEFAGGIVIVHDN